MISYYTGQAPIVIYSMFTIDYTFLTPMAFLSHATRDRSYRDGDPWLWRVDRAEPGANLYSSTLALRLCYQGEGGMIESFIGESTRVVAIPVAYGYTDATR